MMSAARSLQAIISIALLSLLIGCGSKSTNPIVVTMTPGTNQGIDQAQTVALTASVANDPKNAGVTWAVGGVGTLSNKSSTGATFNAPASVTSKALASVTATSVSNPAIYASIQIAVNPLPAISTTSLPAATITENYSAAVTVNGGTSPFTWTITSGSLPTGLTLGSSTSSSVTISGTPTVLGSSTVTIQAADAAGNSSSQQLTLAVNPPGPLGITTASLPTGALTVVYSQTLAATGGITPYTWSVTTGSLPNGLTLNSSSGFISGTPTAIGTSSFTVKVTDAESPAQTATANLSITINNAPVHITTTNPLPQGVINNPYSGITLQAAGGTTPYSWSNTGSLPPGLSLSTTGAITGTPTSAGTFSFTATVTDSSNPVQTASASFSIIVNPTLTITTTSLPNGSKGTAYTATLQATGGLTPYTWTVSSGSLPGGLTLNAGSGTISGTPNAIGTFNFEIQVADSETPTEESVENFSIVISSASCPNNASFTGNYAIAMEGWNTDSTAVQSAAVASFIADGAGNITSGLLNTNDGTNGPRNGTFTGTYCVASDNLGTLTLNLGSPYSTSHTFAIALNSSGANGRIIYYDATNTKAVGPLRKQNTTAFSTSKIDGNYAFGMIGTGAGGVGSRFGIAGQFAADGKGNLTGFADADNSLSGASSDATLSASGLTVNSNGSGTVAIAFNGGTINFNLNFAFFVVNSGELLMMETDNAQSGEPLLVGHVLLQNGTFSDSSLNGNSILGVQSIDYSNVVPSPEVVGGIFNANGTGSSASINFDQNDGGTLTTQTGTGTYSVASNGRVTLTGFSSSPVFYLYGQNEGFVIGTDSGVSFGQFFPQTGSNFTKSSFSGTYAGGSDHPQNVNASEEVISVTADGAGNLTGTSETNVNGGSPAQNSITATYTAATNGRVVVSQSGSQSEILYIINSGAVLAIPGNTHDTDPTLDWLQQ